MGSRLTGFLRGLIGSGASGEGPQDAGATVDYKGYTIRPASRRQGAQWLTVGVISKAFDGGDIKEHHFIRADTYGSKQDADDCSVLKAKQIIDEQGDKMFQKS